LVIYSLTIKTFVSLQLPHAEALYWVGLVSTIFTMIFILSRPILALC